MHHTRSRALRCALLAALAAAAPAPQPARACPPPPEALERAAAEGRLGELAAVERAARARGVNAAAAPDLAARPAAPAGGPTRFRQAVVLLVEFADNQADEAAHPPGHYQDLLFSSGLWPTGSLRDYFLENSYGDFDVTGAVTVWLTLPQTYAWYADGRYGLGDYPRNAQRMAEDAVLAADPLVDFSLFDNDGPDGLADSGDDDGRVDALFVVHAGPEGAGGGGGAVWSHAWETSYEVPVDGVVARRYSTEPEDGTIGVFCHEFGHVLGLPDLYDYDYDAYGLGRWSLMAYGVHVDGGRTPTHLDAWSKARLGFLQPVAPEILLFGETIRPAETHPAAYYLWRDGAASHEYFLLEYRRQLGFDAGIPGEGLLIYHVDELMPDNDAQRCGSGSPHCKVALLQADGECELELRTSIWDPGDPFPGGGGVGNPNTEFTGATTPSSLAWDGTASEVAVLNIALHDSFATADFIVTDDFAAVEAAEAAGGAGASSSPGGIRAAPNPWRPERDGSLAIGLAPGAASGELRVFAPSGRLVRRLPVAGPGAAWDGRDEAGRRVPSGAYFLLGGPPGGGAAVKVLLER